MAAVAPVQDIRFKRAIVSATDFGAKPELRWLEISALVIDRAYQREILENGMDSIRRIIAGFLWSRFGALLVSDRGGQFALVDGQHRAIAAKALRIAKVPCIVIRASQEEEALAFAAINGAITRLHALQIFHARIAGGDKAAKALLAACHACDVVIPRHPGVITKPGETHSIGALQRVYQQHGEKVLQMTLRAVVETGGGNIGRLKPAVIGGLADALVEKPKWQRNQGALNALIERVGIKKLLSTVDRIRAVDGGAARKLFAQQVLKHFDKEDAAKAA